MDRTLDIHTPESIAFRYELAGIGSRFLAVAIDLALQTAMLFLISWGFYWLGTTAAKHVKHVPRSGDLGTNIVIAILIAIVFMIFFGYFILFEAFWNGQTPGKKALGIRVVRDGGYPLDFTASLVRNLIRIGEMIFGFYAISSVAAVFSPMNKRIGDLAAGTVVVREAKMASPADFLKEMRAEPVYASTAYVTGEERALIKRFLDRRDVLSHQRRAELAAQIATRVRDRLPVDMQTLPDEALLERL